MRKFAFILLIVLLSQACSRSVNKDSEQTKPNIIFIIADDMTRDMFNFLPEGEGRNLTPNLDRLAGEGTVMKNQYVASPVCTPSRYNVLTGKYASRSAFKGFIHETKKYDGQTVVRWNSYIVPGENTLPKLLKQSNYITGAAGKNHVIAVPGWNKVDFLSDPNDPEISKKLIANEDLIRQAFQSAGFNYAEHINNRNPDGNGPKAYAVHNLDWHTEAALNFIDQNKGNPFFLYFATTIPHGPGSRDRSWGADRRITPYGILDEPLSILSSEEEIEKRLKNSGIEIDARQFDQKANLLWMDDALGEIIKKLEEYGIDDNTIIFFFNDHGQGAKGTLYESGIRNPSIVWRKKGFKSGGVSPVRISNIDFTPTILDFAGIEIESKQFDGKSFKNTLLDGSNEEIHESMYFEMGFTRALIKGDYKYLALRYPESLANMSYEERIQTLEDAIDRLKIRGIAPITTDPSAPFSHLSPIPGGWDAERSSTGEYPYYYDRDQLYNIIKDPGELENLAEKDAEILLELKEELNKYVMDLPGNFNTN